MPRPDRDTRLDWADSLWRYRMSQGWTRSRLAREVGLANELSVIAELAAIERGAYTPPELRAIVGEGLEAAEMLLTEGERRRIDLDRFQAAFRALNPTLP